MFPVRGVKKRVLTLTVPAVACSLLTVPRVQPAVACSLLTVPRVQPAVACSLLTITGTVTNADHLKFIK